MQAGTSNPHNVTCNPFDVRFNTRRRSYALPQPEENAHAAAVRCRGPLVQPVGHLEQNAMRNMEMLSGSASGVTPGQKSLAVISAELRRAESRQRSRAFTRLDCTMAAFRPHVSSFS